MRSLTCYPQPASWTRWSECTGRCGAHAASTTLALHHLMLAEEPFLRYMVCQSAPLQGVSALRASRQAPGASSRPPVCPQATCALLEKESRRYNSLLSSDACWPAPAQELTVEQFVERFERPRIPVVLTGLCDGWRAGQAWGQQELLKHYGEHKFKVLVLHAAWAAW